MNLEKFLIQFLNRLKAILKQANKNGNLISNSDFKYSISKDLQMLEMNLNNWVKEAVNNYLKGAKNIKGKPVKKITPVNLNQKPLYKDTNEFDEILKKGVGLENFTGHKSALGVILMNREIVGNQIMNHITRGINDVYYKTATTVFTDNFQEGDLYTRQMYTDELIQKFTDDGIISFTTKNGRNIPIDEYSEMVSRTMTLQAEREGKLNRLQETGNDLILVSSHLGCCKYCQRYNGKVLSISGNDKRYPSLQEAQDNHLFHPNCRHTFTPYTGHKPKYLYSEEEQKLIDQYGEKKANEIIYINSQKQRRLEREVRQNKTAYELTHKEEYKKLVSKKQKQLREFINTNPYLKRKPQREQIRFVPKRFASFAEDLKTVKKATQYIEVGFRDIKTREQAIEYIEKDLKTKVNISKLTDEVVNEISKEYARAKELSGLKLDKITDDIDDACKLMKCSKKEFTKYYSDAYALSDTDNNVLWVNPKYFSKENIEDTKLNFDIEVNKWYYHTPGSQLEAQTMSHEFGHFIETDMQKKIRASKDPELTRLLGEDHVRFMNKQKEYKLIKNKKKASKEFLENYSSVYGLSNYSEYFAETYAEFNTSIKPREYTKSTMSIVDKVNARYK